MPSLIICPTQITKTGSVGSVYVPRAVQLFTFGPCGQYNALRRSWMVSKNQQKNGEANGMPSLPRDSPAFKKTTCHPTKIG